MLIHGGKTASFSKSRTFCYKNSFFHNFFVWLYVKSAHRIIRNMV